MATLYLLETRAAKNYICPACESTIPRGAAHFRHDPHPHAQMFRGQKYSHWCYQCIMATEPGPRNRITKRLRIPQARVLAGISTIKGNGALLEPMRVGLIGIGHALAERLLYINDNERSSHATDPGASPSARPVTIPPA